MSAANESRCVAHSLRSFDTTQRNMLIVAGLCYNFQQSAKRVGLEAWEHGHSFRGAITKSICEVHRAEPTNNILTLVTTTADERNE